MKTYSTFSSRYANVYFVKIEIFIKNALIFLKHDELTRSLLLLNTLLLIVIVLKLLRKGIRRIVLTNCFIFYRLIVSVNTIELKYIQQYFNVIHINKDNYAYKRILNKLDRQTNIDKYDCTYLLLQNIISKTEPNFDVNKGYLTAFS